jgi:predicted HTH transcriptional regulator
MIELCREAGLPEPSYELRAGCFVLTLWRDWLTNDVLAQLDLNERQRQAIALVKGQGQITNQTLRERTGVTARTASRDLEYLAGKGLITRVGDTGRNTYYVLARRKQDVNPTNRT